MDVHFLKPEQYQPQCYQIFLHYLAQLAELLPHARIEHIGSSAIQGAISKGDLDILVSVDAEQHAASVRLLEQNGFSIKHDSVSTPELSTLLSDVRDGVTIRLIATGSKYECFVSFRDCMNSNPTLLSRYNALKQDCEGVAFAVYRKRKAEFILQILKECECSKHQWQTRGLSEHYLGSCLCGEVRFEVTGPIRSVVHCHCKQCQKGFGAAFATFGVCSFADFSIVSGLDKIQSYQSSDDVKRTFCRCCGSNLQWVNENDYMEYASFCLTLLDTPYSPSNQKHIYCKSKPSWLKLTDQHPKYAVLET